jgi:hypothetical protein
MPVNMTGILEEELQRANDERKQIVRKYQIGRENIKNINKWVCLSYLINLVRFHHFLFF